jgi:hypothetical protein
MASNLSYGCPRSATPELTAALFAFEDAPRALGQVDYVPFPPQTPRPFTREAIEGIVPGTVGVYGLLREGRWIYIGRGDIRARLLAHVNGDNACITRQQPTHYVSVRDLNDALRERDLLLELRPTACNQRV